VTLEELKESCNEHMFWCYGTSAIFQRRERSLKTRREWITYLGIIGPIVIGSAVGAFGRDWKIGGFEVVPIIVTVASAVGIVQIVLSTWALVARWDEAYGAAQESVKANNDLYHQFRSLRDMPSQDYMAALELLRQENTRQEAQDYRQSITETEKRYAYHQSMRYLRKPCEECQLVPSGKSSRCNACGRW
jgi:mobilome CxxCx(11)CxxC protein